MIESRLLVAKPFALILNQSRSGEATAYTSASSSCFWQSFYFACAKA